METNKQSYVYFALKGDDFDPNEITDKLRIEPTVSYLIKGEPYQKFNLGPIELIVSYDFKLVDLNSKKEFPDQQYTSSILIWLSRTNSCNLTLCMPFELTQACLQRSLSHLRKIKDLLCGNSAASAVNFYSCISGLFFYVN